MTRAVRRLGGLVLSGALVLAGAEGLATAARPERARIGACDWPMWGYSPQRTFSTTCRTHLAPSTARRLRLRWFTNTYDVVTATPTLVDGTLYVGDWSGRFYALRADNGHVRWTFRARVHPNVYSGQIVGSAAVADVGGVGTVFVPAGKTLYALRAADGHVRWKRELGPPGDPRTATEIEASPVVVGGMVIFGWDVHNSGSGDPAGVMALDARTGAERWRTVTAPTGGEGATGPGCGDVWSSPSVDSEHGLVFSATGNCVQLARWGRFSEAMLALDLHTGAVRWVYQPHRANLDDLDFAGAPNVFDVGGRALVGLGNKDGTYYALDRVTGFPAWRVRATGPGETAPGTNFSTGGFIGPTAYAGGIVVGGTAVGPPPYLHAIDATRGTLAWQSQEPGATYAATAVANGVVILGGTDFTLRAIDLRSGRTLWSSPMQGAVSGGAVVTTDDVFAVAGIREPGLAGRSHTSGVYRFSLHGNRARLHLAEPPAPAPAGPTPSGPRRCITSPCDVPFDLKKPPPGLTPRITLHVAERPFRVEVHASGLGPPSGWLRPGSPAAQAGATAYGVFVSESDDNPTGGLVCVLDASLACTASKIPRPGATYNRVSLVAVKDPHTLPTLADGFDRLVATVSFSPPLRPQR